ncbi:zinc finger protein 830 [Schistocerca piceifrons]|uniref:zinc finger protein 830 n=1 Tax=Schistocerca piceifrons TaxID=274613 RepID=UPI001F5ECF9C|nr:zinc finger protein 830 [Schistocerca piceifrons]
MTTAMNAMKKKVTQNDLRRIMSEQKQKLLQSVKKIDSPLAKYTDSGQLTCILCDSVVRSEAVWTVHINSKQHRENVAQVKKKREAERERERIAELARVQVKRRPPTPPPQPAKKLKSILKNASESPPIIVNSIPPDFFDGSAQMKTAPPATLPEKKTVPARVLLVRGVPSDDDEEDEVENDGDEAVLKAKEEEAETDAKDEKAAKNSKVAAEDALPEGFFDDPLLDAKARNVEYKDPVEEEWERFQREIKATENMSAAIIAEDQEAATAERQIDEIDEQIRNWSRVLDLERKKELVAQQSNTSGKGGGGASDEESPNSSDELDPDSFDEYLDWRAKKSFK